MAKRILIADDSVTIQKAFAMTFAGSGDVTLASARSADEGLAVAQKLHPDLIIADAVMPGRTGYELCASLRADPNLRSVPVYILSSAQQPYDEARGQKAGADGHLTKPWETAAMLDKIRELLQRGGGASALQPAGHGIPAPPPPRPATSMPVSVDDEYGEISIEAGRDTAPERRARIETPPPPPALRKSNPSMPSVSSLGMSGAPAAHPSAPPGGHPPGQSALRPSLIPGMRPGSVAPARPGSTPSRPATNPGMPPAPPPRPAAAPIGRTLMGVPAANVPIPGVMRPPTPPMPMAAPPPRPATGPQPPVVARTPTAPLGPVTPPAPAAPPAVSPSAISSSIEQKLASISAKGPEYEAIAKLSREIIEQVVWEVVPELAEAIIRDHLEKRGRV